MARSRWNSVFVFVTFRLQHVKSDAASMILHPVRIAACEIQRLMNVYRTQRHRRPLLIGTIDADPPPAVLVDFELDLFLHPGGLKEWAIALRTGDDPSRLPGWRPTPPEVER